MKSRLALATCLMAMVMLGLAQVTAQAGSDAKKKVEVSSTQQIEFTPGGIGKVVEQPTQ